MTVDLLAIALLVIATILGWRSGAVAQIGRIGAAILAFVGAPYAAGPVGEVLFAESEWSEMAVRAVSLFVAGVLIYVAVAVTGWLIVRAMRVVSDNLTLLDRLGGSMIGGIKGLIAVYFVMTVFVLLQVPAEQVDPQNALALRGGYGTAFVEEHNILAPWHLPRLDALHAALKVRYYADELDRERVLREHAEAADFLRKEAIVGLASDKALMQAVLDDRYAFTLADPRVRAVLDDTSLTQRLTAVDWQALLAEVKSPVHA